MADVTKWKTVMAGTAALKAIHAPNTECMDFAGSLAENMNSCAAAVSKDCQAVGGEPSGHVPIVDAGGPAMQQAAMDQIRLHPDVPGHSTW